MLTNVLQEYIIDWLHLQVTIFDISQYKKPFNCLTSRPKLYQSLLNFVVVFRNVCRTIMEKANRKPEFVNETFKKYEKWHYMRLTLQRKLSVYIGLQKVLYLHQPNLKLEQNSEIEHECSLPFVDVMRITSPGLAVRTWVKMDVHRSVLKRKR